MESAHGSKSAIKVSARLHNGSQKYIAQIDSRKWENVICWKHDFYKYLSNSSACFQRRKWILHRLVYKLSDHNDNSDIQIVIEGLKANPFAIIAAHGLMGCNPDGILLNSLISWNVTLQTIELNWNGVSFIILQFFMFTVSKMKKKSPWLISISINQNRSFATYQLSKMPKVSWSFPNYRYHYNYFSTISSESIKSCPPCLHGGECESSSGQCVCPPGFTGDVCEEGRVQRSWYSRRWINNLRVPSAGCGENSFGGDCLGQCSGREDGCTGLILCVPLIGCNCAPGYSGNGCDIGSNFTSCFSRYYCQSVLIIFSRVSSRAVWHKLLIHMW